MYQYYLFIIYFSIMIYLLHCFLNLLFKYYYYLLLFMILLFIYFIWKLLYSFTTLVIDLWFLYFIIYSDLFFTILSLFTLWWCIYFCDLCLQVDSLSEEQNFLSEALRAHEPFCPIMHCSFTSSSLQPDAAARSVWGQWPFTSGSSCQIMNWLAARGRRLSSISCLQAAGLCWPLVAAKSHHTSRILY